MNEAKTKTIFDERDALQRDNERLLAAFENKALECVKLHEQLNAEARNTDAANRNYRWAHQQWDETKAELAAARKVADAACKWFDICEDEDADSRPWWQLVDAIREYRARAESPPLEARIAKACDLLEDEDALAEMETKQ